MRSSRLLYLCLAFALSPPASAVADPINFYIGGNLTGVTTIDKTASVADPAQGLTLTFVTYLTQSGASNLGSLDTNSYLWINAGTPLNSPALNLWVHLDGSIAANPGNVSSLHGGFTGTVFSAIAASDWTASGGVSPWLVDLAAHPERIHISGVVTGGVNNILETTLTIDPPAAVPEPSTLSIALAAIGGCAIVRRRFRRRPQAVGYFV